MRRIFDLPFLVILMGIGAVAMFLPAAHAAVLKDFHVAQSFMYSAVIFLILAIIIGIATSNYRPRNMARSQLMALIGAYICLPPMLAVPFDEALPDTTYLNAWFEMVSSFTTTGATLYDNTGRLAPSLHLWRALVGWLGGFFVLLTAAAILAPLDLGGAEVVSGRIPGSAAQGNNQDMRMAESSERLVKHTLILFPAYAGLTLLLWVILLTLGDSGLVALMHAMSSLSTSGISPIASLGEAGSGRLGELALFCFLALAVTRRSLPGAVLTDRSLPVQRDHEVQLACLFLLTVPTVLFLRHWIGAIGAQEAANWMEALKALWGTVFMTLSFLTTTGFESSDWQEAQSWSGLNAPGLVLLGLAMMGGGIATTAGGLKLLRVYALARHGERELDRLVHPSSIGGGGDAARQLRRSGAYVAWIFFMLFALTFAVVVAILTLLGLEFENALVLAVMAVTTTGPLSVLATEEPIRMLELATAAKFTLAAAMIVGRVEVLGIIALFAPGVWRR